VTDPAALATTRTLSYAYNSAGQLSTVTTSSGKQVVYTYANNRPVSVTVDGVAVLNTTFYEPFGPNGGWHWGNSTQANPNTHTRTFDKDFRTTRVTSDLPVSGTQPYFDRQVGWDIQSRVQSMTDLANSALNATYGYDALDRVTSTTQGTSTWGYTFNGVGDRLTSTVNSATTSYGYFSGSHKLQSLSGAQSKSYAVDAAGNMTSDGTTTWTYAGNNRPTQAGTTTFLVNALGQRVKKTIGGTAMHFVYDESGRLWGEYDNTGALIAETIWLDDLPVGTSGAALSYVHPDHLGTPRMITRSNDNAILWRWDNTDPFGNSQPDTNPSGLGTFAYNLRFPGQYFDQETGTHFNWMRDYDPGIGRYIESDPIGLKGGINTFAYATGSPLRFVDPRGLAIQLCTRAAQGMPGNHRYMWDTRNKKSCGMRQSSGHGGDPNFQEKGPGPGGDTCGDPIPGSDGMEAAAMKCCADSNASQAWVPGFNDCYTVASRCLKGLPAAGDNGPGRFDTKCPSCWKPENQPLDTPSGS
jgi:RHS repeat-associated protein